jgi:arginine decarboxylase
LITHFFAPFSKILLNLPAETRDTRVGTIADLQGLYMSNWTTKQSTDLYNVAHWGDGYFSISEKGDLVVHPGANPDVAVSLPEVVNLAHQQGLSLPLLVRFSGILHHRVRSLQASFENAIEKHGHQARYTAAYPIKVNQQHSVVQELLASGKNGLGLEVGSKPELMAVLAMSPIGGTIICNGYKDREYFRLALIAQRLGHHVYIVVEKLSELTKVIKESRSLGVRPSLGVRLRLASLGKGKWQNTGGEKSKFGLSAGELMKVVETLKSETMLDNLEMIHFHMGSQISNIRDIEAGMQEGVRYYAELCRNGADIRCINVGGGLGVDYEGTRSRSFCSINYNVKEYAETIVRVLSGTCKEEDLQFPELISESGRAMTAHHAMLLTNVLETERIPEGVVENVSGESDPKLKALQSILSGEEPQSVTEAYEDASDQLDELLKQFSRGGLSLSQRAQAENLYYAICQKVLQGLNPDNHEHQKLGERLNERMADKYFLNFSLFQSLPDSWAIDQVFPIMPLHRLNEPPVRRATIEDITCDSDGRIDLFPRSDGLSATVPMHEPRSGESYLVGFFMLGAYQEILGDMHNLFGDTDSVHIRVDDKGSFSITDPLRGDSVDHVLSLVHFKSIWMREVYAKKVQNSDLDTDTRAQYLQELEDGLTGYTYLED